MDYKILCFCEIIKNVIHFNEEKHLEKEIDWDYMVQLGKRHNILPIIIEGAVKDNLYIKRPEYDEDMRESLAVVSGQIKRTSAFLDLYKIFIEAELYPVVMKGLICRNLYGDLRDHRPSGDEDILIRPQEYWRVRDVLIANGYVPEIEVNSDEQLEWLQEISFVNPEEKLHIELHFNPMGRENDTRSRMSDCFRSVFDNYREVEINGVRVRTMNHQEHLLFLILHAFKHFIGGGFGIRQCLDILMYQKMHGSEIDLKALDESLRVLRADTFWSDIIHIGNMYLGFDLLAMQEPNCPIELLEDMIQCGVFGDKSLAGVTAARTTMFSTGDYLKNKKSNILKMIFRAIFPSKSYLLYYSPYLKQKPWLLPLAWVRRWGRFLKRSKNNKGSTAVESIQISRRRSKLLKKYHLV